MSRKSKLNVLFFDDSKFVKRKYSKLRRQITLSTHPDKHKDKKNHENMKEFNDAFDQLLQQ